MKNTDFFNTIYFSKLSIFKDHYNYNFISICHGEHFNLTCYRSCKVCQQFFCIQFRDHQQKMSVHIWKTKHKQTNKQKTVSKLFSDVCSVIVIGISSSKVIQCKDIGFVVCFSIHLLQTKVDMASKSGTKQRTLVLWGNDPFILLRVSLTESTTETDGNVISFVVVRL